MKSSLAELRSAVRSQLDTPLVTVAVLLSLALGVGAAATVINLVDVLLLRGPEVPRPDGLVSLYSRTPDGAAAAVPVRLRLPCRFARPAVPVYLRRSPARDRAT